MSEVITTELLGEHPALHRIATDEQLSTSWIRGNEGFIGFGEWRSASVKGPNRFADARKWWHEQLNSLKIVNEVHGIGTGPILFTSFSFDQDEESRLVIPKIVIGQRGNKSWITWIGDKPQPRIQSSLTNIQPPKINWIDNSTDLWREKVNLAISEIQKGRLDKVVLAREIIGHGESEIDPRFVLRNLANEYPATWVYSNNGLVGATPELLLRLSKSMVVSRILAGTISKTGDDDKDLALAASLASWVVQFGNS